MIKLEGRLDGSILPDIDNKRSEPMEMPSAFEQLIGASPLLGHDGIGRLMALFSEEPRLRNALTLRTATRLRDVLEAHPYDADEATPVELDLQDCAVLLDLLLRKLG